MSVTRTAVFIGIMCAAWMTSPLTANAVEFQKFVGLSDKYSINVKKCAVDLKGAKKTYSSGKALDVELRVDLFDGDGLGRGDDFDAVLYFGETPTPLFSGTWSRIRERDGKSTYQLTPSGDLAASPPSDGWEVLLDFMNEAAVDACTMKWPDKVYQSAKVYWALSEIVKGTLVIQTNENGQIACPADEGLCSRAWIRLDVKSFMDGRVGGEVYDGWGSAKTDLVKFKYEANGYVRYVLGTDPVATPTATPTAIPTATPTATPTPTPTAVP